MSKMTAGVKSAAAWTAAPSVHSPIVAKSPKNTRIAAPIRSGCTAETVSGGPALAKENGVGPLRRLPLLGLWSLALDGHAIARADLRVVVPQGHVLRAAIV